MLLGLPEKSEIKKIVSKKQIYEKYSKEFNSIRKKILMMRLKKLLLLMKFQNILWIVKKEKK